MIDADRWDEAEALVDYLTGELGPRQSDHVRVRVRDLVQALAARDRGLDSLAHQARLGSTSQDQKLIGHWYLPGDPRRRRPSQQPDAQFIRHPVNDGRDLMEEAVLVRRRRHRWNRSRAVIDL